MIQLDMYARIIRIEIHTRYPTRLIYLVRAYARTLVSPLRSKNAVNRIRIQI